MSHAVIQRTTGRAGSGSHSRNRWSTRSACRIRAFAELGHVVRRSGRRVEIYLQGRLYAAGLPALARLIDAEEKEGLDALTLDFADVTHLDSRGIGALVGWNRHFHGERIEFYARHLQGEVRQALQVCNLIQLFNPGPAPDDPRVTATIDRALAAPA